MDILQRSNLDLSLVKPIVGHTYCVTEEQHYTFAKQRCNSSPPRVPRSPYLSLHLATRLASLVRPIRRGDRSSILCPCKYRPAVIRHTPSVVTCVRSVFQRFNLETGPAPGSFELFRGHFHHLEVNECKQQFWQLIPHFELLRAEFTRTECYISPCEEYHHIP